MTAALLSLPSAPENTLAGQGGDRAARAALALAGLFDYPGEDSLRRIDAARDAFACPELDAFGEALAALSPDAREELHAATFDVTPSCVPYLGIHLFGEENFKRGEFMAALLARYAETGFAPGGELPDHLATVLRFFAGAGEAERRELAEYCLLAPVETMARGLSPENPYRSLLGAVRAWLDATFPGLRPFLPRPAVPGGAAPGCGGCSCGAPGPGGMDHDREILTESLYD
jgi:nitrate reductase delta subunit